MVRFDDPTYGGLANYYTINVVLAFLNSVLIDCKTASIRYKLSQLVIICLLEEKKTNINFFFNKTSGDKPVNGITTHCRVRLI